MLQGDVPEEERSYAAAKQASLENEIKQLKQELRCYLNKEDETKRRLHGMSVWNLKFSILK